MPPRLKRRSEAISRNASESEDEGDEQQQRARRRQRQRRSASPTAAPAATATVSDAENDNISNAVDSDDEDNAQDSQTHHKTMVKKLVRLALSAEYSRQPIRRTDINAKVLKSGSGASGSRSTFRTVFTSAQQILRDVFGMEMVDLPSRERTGIAERRKAATQKATQRETQAQTQGRLAKDEDTQTQTQRGKDPVLSAQNWILVSTLPIAYRVHPTLLRPSRAPDTPTEAAYTALYTLVVSLIYLHAPSGGSSDDVEGDDTTEPLSDAKLHRFLSRFDLDAFVPAPVEMSLEKALGRMIKEGYVERRRDTSSGEEVVEWVVGPRGKKEIGRTGIARLVRGVYGFGVDGKGKGLQQVANVSAEDEDEEQEDGSSRRRLPVKMERDELERRLERTLGGVVKLDIRAPSNPDVVNGDHQQQEEEEEDHTSRRNGRGENVRRSTRRRGQDDDDDE